MAKRAFDIIFAGIALVLLSPFFLVVAALIRLDSRGPVFYVARRCGQHRRPFNFYKFRTMVVNAAHLGSSVLTTDTDIRVTRLGKYLRLFKIDELPQLLNVLRGDMSVVGPRPEVYGVVDNYYVAQWDRVLAVRPGITCLLQIEVFPDFTVAHKGVGDPFRYYIEHDLPQKLQLDIEYIERASFWLEVKIIVQTLYCIMFKSWSCLRRSRSLSTTGSNCSDRQNLKVGN